MLLSLPSQLSSFEKKNTPATVILSVLDVAKHSRIEPSAAILNAELLMKLIGLAH